MCNNSVSQFKYENKNDLDLWHLSESDYAYLRLIAEKRTSYNEWCIEPDDLLQDALLAALEGYKDQGVPLQHFLNRVMTIQGARSRRPRSVQIRTFTDYDRENETGENYIARKYAHVPGIHVDDVTGMAESIGERVNERARQMLKIMAESIRRDSGPGCDEYDNPPRILHYSMHKRKMVPGKHPNYHFAAGQMNRNLARAMNVTENTIFAAKTELRRATRRAMAEGMI